MFEIGIEEETNNFDVNKFVRDLKNEGGKMSCDNSSEFFRKMELPKFYDEVKFKRGQKFFHDHIFAMFYGKLLGLVSDLAFPDGQAILRYTKKSCEPEAAFRRYIGTIMHMYTWYSSNLKPDSALWQSLIRVRNYHNAASNLCRNNRIGEITQYQMAMTQFGFMGYILVRPKFIGLHKYADEDFEGFVHFWRVLGHLLGIEERFNICRSSLKITKLVCEEVIKQFVKKEVLKWDSIFVSMTKVLTDGMWCMIPILNKNVCLRHLYDMLADENDHKTKSLEAPKLNYFERFIYYFVLFTLYLLKFDFIRTFQNYHMYLILYLTEKFPFLAYYKFRKVDFQVKHPEQKIVNYVN